MDIKRSEFEANYMSKTRKAYAKELGVSVSTLDKVAKKLGLKRQKGIVRKINIIDG